MSMILDALRRADSERERGAVPGLHAQPVAPPTIDVAAKRRAQPWHWIAIGLLVATAVSLAGFIAGRESPRAIPEVASSEVPTVASAPIAPAAMPAPNREAAAPVAQAAPWPQPESRVPARPSAEAPVAASTGTGANAPANAVPAEAPIHPREQLPEQIRADLPQIAIGGSMYSSNPANRSLIVNGGLYRESDSVAADLVLEQIKLRAAVFRFKGYRFEIQF